MYNELYHYGIKNQKWYVRRFQNPDGTLTEEGKQRYRNVGTERLAARSSYIDKRADRLAAKAGTFSTYASGRAGAQTKAIHELNARILADDERLVRFGKRTVNKRLGANIGMVVGYTGAGAAIVSALLTGGVTAPIAGAAVAGLGTGVGSTVAKRQLRR